MLKAIFSQNIEDFISLSLPSIDGMEKSAISLIALFLCRGAAIFLWLYLGSSFLLCTLRFHSDLSRYAVLIISCLGFFELPAYDN